MIFGLTADQVEARRHTGPSPRQIIEATPALKEVLDAVAGACFRPMKGTGIKALCAGSRTMTGSWWRPIWPDYARAQEHVAALWRDTPRAWQRSAVLNTAHAGWFHLRSRHPPICRGDLDRSGGQPSSRTREAPAGDRLRARARRDAGMSAAVGRLGLLPAPGARDPRRGRPQCGRVSARHASRILFCLFDERGEREGCALHPPGADGRCAPRPHSRRRRRCALWFARRGAFRALARPPLRSGEAARRSLCEAPRSPLPLRPGTGSSARSGRARHGAFRATRHRAGKTA